MRAWKIPAWVNPQASHAARANPRRRRRRLPPRPRSVPAGDPGGRRVLTAVGGARQAQAAPRPPPAGSRAASQRPTETRAAWMAPEAATPPAPPVAEPGEFTRLLRAQSPPPAEAQPPSTPSPVASATQPGEFTRLLKPDASRERTGFHAAHPAGCRCRAGRVYATAAGAAEGTAGYSKSDSTSARGWRVHAIAEDSAGIAGWTLHRGPRRLRQCFPRPPGTPSSAPAPPPAPEAESSRDC